MQPIIFSVYKFSSNCLASKKAPFPDAQELLEALWKKISVYVCISVNVCISVWKKNLFQRHSKILFDGMRRGKGKLNNFFKAARCLGLFGSSKFFILIGNYFSVLKHRKFPDHMDFIGNIMIKFLIRSPFLSI